MYHPGLHARAAVGGHGRYHDLATDGFHAFPFGIMREHGWWRGGPEEELIYTIDRPPVYLSRQRDHSWTGLTMEYAREEAGGMRPYLVAHWRSLLPAPLLVPQGGLADRLRLHFPFTTSPRSVRSLMTEETWGLDETELRGESRAFLFESRRVPVLFLSSIPLTHVSVYCQRHIEWVFGGPEPRVMLVPLWNRADVEQIGQHLESWLALLEHPPVEVEEEYAWEADGRGVRIRQRAIGLDGGVAGFSPVPPFVSVLGEMPCGEEPLVELESGGQSIDLLDTNLGPYRLVPGPELVMRVAAGWMGARMESTVEIHAAAELAPVPEELAYAGDWTWDPAEPMDQLLSCRTWAPLLRAIPEPRLGELLAILDVPEPEAFRGSLLWVKEPTTGHVWAKDDFLFHQKGRHVSFDTDWYNGLSLSGLYRATECGVPELEAKARRLATDCGKEREALIAYFTLFHDWQIGVASMETHFPYLNADCCHNGMEGLLAEAKLREAEGNDGGAAFCRYLAAKTAVALVSAIVLPRWVERWNPDFIIQPQPGDHWMSAEPDPRLFGAMTVSPHKGVAPVTPATKNPYQFAGHFPEYSALLRAHGPMEQFAEIARIWEAEFPRRYADWIGHYCGENWRERFAKEHDQEARVQAPVFYALAPEVCQRLWLLDEDPEEIEARFEPQPINLAEQVLLRARFRLIRE